MEKQNRAIRPDAQPIDEIRITTVPRYKESGLSGDEWRISAKAIFIRKGMVISEKSYSNIEYAVRLLDRDLIHISEGNGGYYGGEGNLCDQEGCSSEVTVKYQMKKEYCRQGHGTELSSPQVRFFCNKHKTRGDCGLDDADRNYIKI